MKQSISFNQFTDAFTSYGRDDQFSYDGLKALFDYLEDLAEDCGTDFELDVIALCCEFSEYDSALACILEAGYSYQVNTEDDEDDQETDALDYLQDHTSVITFNGGVIIQDF
jgi:hypothetical protein